MLSEIYVKEFAEHVGDERHVKFTPGLNVVLGGEHAENSIGKSTLLLIVDYAFGGEQFAKSNAVQPYAVGHHTVHFTFTFDGYSHHFGRDTSRYGIVTKYSDHTYENVVEELSLDDFRLWLKDHYGLEDPDLSWREAIGRFLRVSEDHEVIYTKPLNAVARAADQQGVIALEKLFDVYQPIKKLQLHLDDAEERLSVLNAAVRLELSDYIKLRTASDRKRAQRQLEEAEDELERLRAGLDQRLFNEDIARSEERAIVQASINNLLSTRRTLTARLAAVDQNRFSSPRIMSDEINELSRFLPNLDVTRLAEIEGFHAKLSGILDRELDAQHDRYRQAISAIDHRINAMRTQLAGLGTSSHLNDADWDRAGIINGKVQRLSAQIAAFDKTTATKDEVKQARDELQERRPALLREMTIALNQAMADMNTEIYRGEHNPPEFILREGRAGKQGYSFGTVRDTGAGAKAKNVILFDLAVLQLTRLPAVIHDSTIIKNIADEPVEAIMRIYASTATWGKQVFIAFDKHGSYSEITQEIVNDHTVAELGPGSLSLYGRTWNKKYQQEEEEQ